MPQDHRKAGIKGNLLARRNRNRQDQLDNLLVQIQRRLADTPLAVVGEHLASTISEVQLSSANGASASENCQKLTNYVTRLLEFLPSSFGDRFKFDAQLIDAIAQECSQGACRMSRMLIPKPSQEWGHQSVFMPCYKGSAPDVINLIHMPGDDNLFDIDLLDYAFLCHELGHNILFRGGDAFIAGFGQHLDAVLAPIQKQTLGIRGWSKQVADATAEQVRRYWTPTADQYNWAHEIAVDVISLWLIGPAYLAALQDVMEPDALDPYQLGQSHPPYEIRARALIDTAGRLGWAYYTGAIQTLVDRWSAASASHARNLHVACADPRLLSGTIATALKTCEALSLPCCTPARLAVLEDRQEQSPDFGTDLILAAWLMRNRSTEAAYEEWERTVIKRLLADITE
jgi:hypothetical protein